MSEFDFGIIVKIKGREKETKTKAELFVDENKFTLIAFLRGGDFVILFPSVGRGVTRMEGPVAVTKTERSECPMLRLVSTGAITNRPSHPI